MSEAILERARMLIETHRHAMAEQEIRRALASEPGNGPAHSLLALCLQQQGKQREAISAAREGIGRSPDCGYCHYVLAHLLHQHDQEKSAHESINEALRLDPAEPSFYAALSGILLDLHKPRAALEAADRGLALDAENVECANLRAMALVKMSRKDEAGRAIEGALARDPQNALSHANQGWTCLHANNPKKALEHFSEALRLEPGMEWARDGLLQALRARYVIYRAVLAYYLWMARMTPRGRVGVVVGLFVAMQIGRAVSRQYPEAAPFIWPLLALYFIFVFVTWAAEPLFNLLLRLNRFGRQILNHTEIVVSNCLGLVLLTAIGCGVAYPFVENKGPLVAMAFGCGLLVMVIGGVAGKAEKPSVVARSIIAGILALTFIAAVILYWFVEKNAAMPVAAVFVIGAVLYLWIVTLRAARQ